MVLHLEAPCDVLQGRMTGAGEARRGGKAELGGRSIRPRAKFLPCGELREGQLLEVGKITVDCSNNITRLVR